MWYLHLYLLLALVFTLIYLAFGLASTVNRRKAANYARLKSQGVVQQSSDIMPLVSAHIAVQTTSHPGSTTANSICKFLLTLLFPIIRSNNLAYSKEGQKEMQRAVKKRMAPTVPHGVYARERTKELVFAGEGERRVAERIYDIGSTLAAIKYNLESTRTKVEEGSATPGEITEILAMVKVLNEEVRSVATDMCPWILDDLGIVATISWFCRKFESTHKGIRIEKHITVQEEEIPENLKTVIFRVVQESFHNIARYSKADLFTLSLRRRDAFLDLSVADNGAEFEPSPTTSRQNRREGFGLTAIKERVELSGGSFSFEPVAERGTRIKATWSD